ncbi:MAG: HAD family hydrolase, partial [Oscillospiraceae bacterium]|nr:HAD family hydrolase [Oscillospiraceae bacterium]
EYALNIKLKPGAEEFLRLSAGKHRTVLFTASPSRLYTPLLEHYGIYGCFSDIVCSEDIDADKKTDGYTKLAVFLGISPSDCVVFEDSFLCAQSAKAAGMRVICVYDEFSSKLPGYENIKAISERVITDFGSECDLI